MKRSIFTFLLFFLLAQPVSAAQFYFGAAAEEVSPDSPIEIGVLLDTEQLIVNAVEGTLIIPAHAEVVAIREDGNVIPLWVTPPQVPDQCSDVCEIPFSGIIPGGLAGPSLLLFSVVIQPTGAGELVITTEDERALLHDGKGTDAEIRRAPLTLLLQLDAESAAAIAADITPPDSFEITLIATPEVFEGARAIVFLAQDGESGIDRYEVAEARPGTSGESLRWMPAESPYLLQDQTGRSDIHVRAFDRAGNVRIAVLAAPVTSEMTWVWGIIILFILCVFGFVVWRKRVQSTPRHGRGGSSRSSHAS